MEIFFAEVPKLSLIQGSTQTLQLTTKQQANYKNRGTCKVSLPQHFTVYYVLSQFLTEDYIVFACVCYFAYVLHVCVSEIIFRSKQKRQKALAEEPCDLTKAAWRKPKVRFEHSEPLISVFLSASGVRKVKTNKN